MVGDLDELLFWVEDLIMPKEASAANQSRPDLNTLLACWQTQGSQNV